MNTILDVLEETCKKFEDKIAVKDPERSLKWGEFLIKSKNAGRRLAAFDLERKTGYPIALLGDKSVSLLVAMTGVIYAGGFYIVINPEQPSNRISKILEVSKPEILVCERKYKKKLDESGYNGKVLELETLTELNNDYYLSSTYDDSKLSACQLANQDTMSIIRKKLDRESPLYGIFTSGSTGTPKCVLVSHGAVIDFIGHFSKIFAFEENDVIASQAPFDFDVSIKDIFTAFFTGASLLLIPREYFSTPKTLMDYICDNGVTSLTWAVSALCIISGFNCFSYRIPDRLRRIMFSGEVMPMKQLNIWMDNISNARFVNLYGPSEITCNCTYYEIKRRFDNDEKLPLGQAFPGRKVFLLDKDGREIKGKNEIGEIAVSGESLAKGYYNNPNETEKHFVNLNGQRTYLTGDLALIGEDKELYFAGRKDFQIKHMGHRIELEEIERSIDKIEGVERCLCTFDQKKNRIYAYYKGIIDKKMLHQKLKADLPLYMVPNRFFHIKEFILNKNGKADRKRLSELEEVKEEPVSNLV
jgi:amino acid adenylation domain-containing protein